MRILRELALRYLFGGCDHGFVAESGRRAPSSRVGTEPFAHSLLVRPLFVHMPGQSEGDGVGVGS